VAVRGEVVDGDADTGRPGPLADVAPGTGTGDGPQQHESERGFVFQVEEADPGRCEVIGDLVVVPGHPAPIDADQPPARRGRHAGHLSP